MQEEPETHNQILYAISQIIRLVPLDVDLSGFQCIDLLYLVDPISRVPLIILEASMDFALSLPALVYAVTTKKYLVSFVAFTVTS